MTRLYTPVATLPLVLLHIIDTPYSLLPWPPPDACVCVREHLDLGVLLSRNPAEERKRGANYAKFSTKRQRVICGEAGPV